LPTLYNTGLTYQIDNNTRYRVGWGGVGWGGVGWGGLGADRIGCFETGPDRIRTKNPVYRTGPDPGFFQAIIHQTGS